MANKPWSSLPEAFLERVEHIIPDTQREAVLESFCVSKPPTFRANTLKISAEDLAKALTDRGIPFQKVPWYPDAFILEGVPQKTLTDTDLYAQGMLYVQNLSSMVPALVLDPHDGENILDLTAAPGSKTTQMAARMHNTGHIVANDKSTVRRYRLAANLKMQGVTNAEVTAMAGEVLWKKYPEQFDRTLIDAPCSLEGTFLATYPKSYEDWTPKKVKILSKMQKFLLRSAISATKPGGIIVYSTCTLEPEENEGVVDWILEKEGESVVVEDIPLSIEVMVSGITKWKEKVFAPELAKTKRILPSATMEGFYVACLRKVASTIPTAARMVE